MTDNKIYFESEDCSPWLKQISLAISQSLLDRYIMPRKEKFRYTDKLRSDIIFSLSTLGISVLLFIIYCGLTWQQKQKRDYTHYMFAVWTLLLILPPIPLILLNQIQFKDYADEQKFFHEVDPILSQIKFYQQFTTITFVILLWIIIGRLKQVEVQVA